MKNKHWEMPASEIPEELVKQVAGILHTYSTGLIKLYSDQWDEEEIMLIGAGTFVSIDDIHGILTVQHVAKEFLSGDHLGLTLSEKEHNFSIPVSQLTIIDIAFPENEGSVGPDLSFIAIPHTFLEQITAYRMFYDLTVRREEFFSIEFSKTDLCMACGMLGHKTTHEEPTGEFERVIGVYGFCAASVVENAFQIGDYDYLDISVDYNLRPDVPTTFRGMSGGGIWRIPLLKDKNNRLLVKDFLYGGVIFYQTEKRDNNRFLRGHGPKSIYGTACETILDHFKN